MRRLTTLFLPAALLAVVLAATSCHEARQPEVPMGVLVCDTALDFGSVVRSSEAIANVTCRNEGTAPLNMTLGPIVQPKPTTSNPAYAPFRLVSPDDAMENHEMPPGVSWEIRVAFLPREIGLNTGKIPFTSTDLKRLLGIIRLTGIGLDDGSGDGAGRDDIGPRIDVQQTLDMGRIAINTFKKRELVIKNGGVAGADEDRLRFVNLEEGISIVTPPVIYDSVDDIDSPYFRLEPNAKGGVFPDGFDPDHGLGARETVTLQVAYTSSEAGDHFGRLVIVTNDPSTPVKVVALRGTAVAREPCAAVYQSTIDFGAVEKNQYLTLALTILNDRDPDDPAVAADTYRYSCELSDMKLTESTRWFRFEDTTAETFPGESGIVLPPGARVVVPIVFAPTTDGPHSGGVTFSISNYNPVSHQPAVVSLVGIARASCLEVQPKKIQFGTIRLGCQSMERSVTLRNGCSYPIRLVGVPTISAVGGIPFTITNPPASNYHFAANWQFDMKVRYRPWRIDGQDEGAVSIVWMDGSVQKTTVVALEGASSIVEINRETFHIPADNMYDILFVIDNSVSMSDKQQALSANLDSFIRWVAQEQDDYHIAVTTTDPGLEQGRFVPVSGTQSQRILTSALGGTALKTQFMSNVMGVGTSGSDTESLIWPAYNALRDPLLTGANAGFLRQDARLHIIVISDTADHDPDDNSIEFYKQFFRTLKGTLNRVRFTAIIPTMASPPAGSGCSYDEPNTGAWRRVKDLATALNGTVSEICQPGWCQELPGPQCSVYGATLVFPLVNEADPSTVRVFINGEPIDRVNTDPPFNPIWSYDGVTNAVVFEETTAPTPGQTLVIEYESPCGLATP